VLLGSGAVAAVLVIVVAIRRRRPQGVQGSEA
jgi:hypothetical protein